MAHSHERHQKRMDALTSTTYALFGLVEAAERIGVDLGSGAHQEGWDSGVRENYVLTAIGGVRKALKGLAEAVERYGSPVRVALRRLGNCELHSDMVEYHGDAKKSFQKMSVGLV